MDQRIEFADHYVEVLGVEARVAVALLGWAWPRAVVRREGPLAPSRETRLRAVSALVFTLSDVCGGSVGMGVLAVWVRVSTSLWPSFDLGATRRLDRGCPAAGARFRGRSAYTV